MDEALKPKDQLVAELVLLRQQVAELEIANSDLWEAHQALVVEAQVHRAVLSNVSDAVLVTDEQGDFKYICPNVSAIFGYSKEEVAEFKNIAGLMGANLFDLDHLHTVGEIKNIGHQIQDKNRKAHFLLINVKSISIDGRSILYTCRDVTHRKKIEIELEYQRQHLEELISKRTQALEQEIEMRKQVEAAHLQSEIHLQALIDAAQDSMLLIDTAGMVVKCNQTVANRFGMTKSDFAGKNAYGFTASDVSEKRRQYVEEALETASIVQFVDKRNGRIIENVLYPVLNQQGQITHIAIYGKDITEQEQALIKLHDSEERFRTLAQLAPAGIYATDRQGHCEYVNTRWLEMAGLTYQQALGGDWVKGLHPEDRQLIADSWYRMVESEGKWGLEYRFQNHEGKTTWVYGLATPRYDDHGELAGYIGVNLDINERKAVEDAQRKTSVLLDSIRQAQSLYIMEGDPQLVFDNLLQTLITITDSEFGFLDEVLYDLDGTPYKLNLAISNLAWDSDSEDLYEQLRNRNLEFRNLNNLAGIPVKLEGPVIANDAPHDPRAAGLPSGHPPIRSFMGLPVRLGDEILGVIGVANRPGGYDERLASFLEPYLSTCAGIIHAIRLREREHQAQKARQESEGQKDLILNATAEMIAYYDTDLRIIWANRASGDSVGKLPDELVGLHCYEIWHQRCEPCENCPVLKARDEKTPQQGQMRTPDGRHWFVRGYPILADDGEVTGLVEFNQDITERLRNEQIRSIQLRLIDYAADHTVTELLQRFLDEAEIMTRSEVGFYHFVEADQETLSLQAWSTNTLQNLCTAEGAGMHYPISAAGVWVDCIRVGKPVIHNDYASLRHKKGLPEGHVPLARELVVPVIRGGKIFAILGVGNKPSDYDANDLEITQQLAEIAWETVLRKRSEQALRESEEKYRALFEQAHDAVFIIDLQGQHQQVNQRASDLLGYSPEEIKHLSIRDLSAQVAESEDVFKRLLDGERIPLYERIFLSKDGTSVPVEINVELVRDSYGRPLHVQSVVRDITERVRAEKQLQSSLREKELLLKEIHHRVKNNLQIVSSLLDLQSNAFQDLAVIRGFLDSKNRIHSMALIHEKLYQSEDFASIDMQDYITSLYNFLLRTYGEKARRIDSRIEAHQVFVEMDTAIPCGMIVNELVSNAIQHAFPAGQSGELQVWFKQFEDEYTLKVSDNGVGLPSDFKIETSSSLGLQLVDLLALQLSGKLRIDPSAGTAVEIIFPVHGRAKEKNNE